MNILIGDAWVYANGPLHIGHLSTLLPGDVLARYHRAKGDNVYYVSGSDCHGTPVAIRAKQEGKTQKEVSDSYSDEFSSCFQKLGFSYDLYGKTSDDWHKKFVREFHKTMYEGDYVYEKSSPQAFCVTCGTALADRFVTGRCPVCGKEARGDQCDACGAVLEPESLVSPVCAVCGGTPELRNTTHLYIAITKLEDQLRAFLNSHPEWRKNAIAFTKRYLDEGLRDRAITRALDWGIDVPKEGYEDKKIYIWAENVLGYLSASYEVAKARGEDFSELWGENAKHYYVHGKDNIPFHTIILPSLLLANGKGWHLPDVIVSGEHLTLEGQKISTSRSWAVWVKDIVDKYQPDSLRYFFLANGPEKRDADFSWREYVSSHNGELLGAYGNFVNRTLAFVWKYFDGRVPEGNLPASLQEKINGLFGSVGRKIEAANLKDALEEIFAFVRFSNRYYDSEKPWETRTADPAACANTIFSCVQLVANLSILLAPFLPFSSKKLFGWLKLTSRWEPQSVALDFSIPEPEILFKRLDKSVIEDETTALKQ